MQEELSPLGNDPQMVKKVATALYKFQVDEARAKISSISFDVSEVKRVMDVAISESDRSAAILLFSYAESAMLDGIQRHLNGEIKGDFKALIAANGLLATAHDRITFLAALRWINKDTYLSLNILRSIRNKFAHNINCDNFSDSTIAGLITSLPDFEKPLKDQLNLPDLNLRETFLMRGILTVNRVMHDICVLPHAIAHQVSPKDVSGTYDNGLQNLKQLGLTFADCILQVWPDKPR